MGISVSCTGPAGVEAVKAALRAGIQSAGLKKIRGEGDELKGHEVETDQISITLIAPPEYVVTTQSLDKENGIKLVKTALNAIEEKLKNLNMVPQKSKLNLVSSANKKNSSSNRPWTRQPRLTNKWPVMMTMTTRLN